MKDLGKVTAFHWYCEAKLTFYAEEAGWTLVGNQGETVRCPRCKKNIPQTFFDDVPWRPPNYHSPANRTSYVRMFKKKLHGCGARLNLWKYNR